ncbi:MAG: hypothetical protein IIZ87_06045, partial [Selenomonas sp.]|nr:hypothetical protein [Selenomonas sp.]
RKAAKKSCRLLVGHLVEQRKVLPPPPDCAVTNKIRQALSVKLQFSSCEGKGYLPLMENT